MSTIRRFLIVGALAAITAACTSNRTQGTPTGSPTHPTGSPTPTTASPTQGTFTSSKFEFPLSLTLVDGWVVQADSTASIDLQRGDQDASISSIASTTVAGIKISDPPMAWPDDLYSWLLTRPEFKPAKPEDVTVGGRTGISIDVAVDPEPGTSIQMVGVGTGSFFLVDRPERWRFIEVRTGENSGIVILTTAPLDAYDASWKAIDQLVATLVFQ